MKKHRRGIEMFSMSFLDVISCGFGAVILLLVLSLALEPATVQKITEDLRGLITQRNDARSTYSGKSGALRRTRRNGQQDFGHFQTDQYVETAV